MQSARTPNPTLASEKRAPHAARCFSASVVRRYRRATATALAFALAVTFGCGTPHRPGGALGALPVIGPRIQDHALREAVEKDPFPRAEKVGLARVDPSKDESPSSRP